jgi:hypothetical protein
VEDGKETAYDGKGAEEDGEGAKGEEIENAQEKWRE